MNNFLYILIGLLLLHLRSAAQDIKLVSPQLNSESLIIATTRKPISENPISFGNESSEDLYYVKAIYENGNWKIELLDSLAKTLSSLDKSKDNLIYVHGDGQSFKDVLESGLRMIMLYNVNIISFDYPSENNEVSSIKNFFISRENAKKSVASFSKFISEIEKFNKEYKFSSNTSILFHSLGNEILRLYANNTLPAHEMLFENVIMNAPAVNYKNYHHWLRKVKMQQQLYIIYNRKDFILSGASLITLKRQLGKKIGRKPTKDAIYISMKKVAGGKHNFFIDMELLEKSPSTKHLFDKMLHGGNPELSCDFMKKNNKKDNIYIIRDDNSCNTDKTLQVNKEPLQ